MRDEIAALKEVRAKRDLGIFADSYVLKDGEIYVSDGRYAAVMPCAMTNGLSRIVPGDELEKLLGRLDSDLRFSSDDGSVTLRAGRMHGTIRTSDPIALTMLMVDQPWTDPPPGLIATMRAARPFVADQAAQPYATCVGLKAGRVIATANVSLIEVTCPDLQINQDMLLPLWAADFCLSADGDLTGVVLAPNYAAFRWSTGLWMRTQLVSGAIPQTIDNLLGSIPDQLPVKLDRAWRKAYNNVAEISKDVITIERNRIVGGAGKSRVEHETDDSGVDGAVHFDPKYLNAVVGLADAWDPNAYPRPVPFRGPGAKGLIVGKRE